MEKLKKIIEMSYVDFMSFIQETNRAPWGEKMLIEMAKSTFLNESKKILHIACNTGSALRELNKLTWCIGLGIDINNNMIENARLLRDKEWINSSDINYEIMDAQALDSPDKIYDISYTTWWMAFVPNKSKAIEEMIRVTKDSWFIADIVMYYKNTPPEYILEEMNKLMNINIQKRNKKYWIDLYENAWLNLFYEFEWWYTDITQEKLLRYCRTMSLNNKELNEIEKKLVEYKLYRIMSLFVENHKYLWACLLVFRKKTLNDQISLFT